MASLLAVFLVIPLLGLLASFALPPHNERLISRTVVLTMGLQFVANLVFVAHWLWSGMAPVSTTNVSLFGSAGYAFNVSLYFDGVTALFSLVGSFLALLVCLYSRIYLHLEAGYKRFFVSVLMFFTGYNIIVFAGNLETIFVGWEVLGVSSFLLVAFYRERYLPARNALKVFTVYRFGDLGLILAIWACHHLFHADIDFSRAVGATDVSAALAASPGMAAVLALALLLAASAKSAQLPFSSWLPRAMEGPTPSSAIFYGSLSVHMGVFLLLRTYPLWEPLPAARVLVALVGGATAIVATGIARVQPSVKSQIAYSSIAQLGIMFMELSAGLHGLALLHFAGNAFLRTYQLLVSPSVVSYLIREQFFQFQPRAHSLEVSFRKRVEHSLYLMCLREWRLDLLAYRLLWSPLKRMGRRLVVVATRPVAITLAMLFGVGCAALGVAGTSPTFDGLRPWLSMLPAVVSLGLVLRSLAETRHAGTSWAMLMASCFWVALAMAFNGGYTLADAAMYLGGVTASGIGGWVCLRRLSHTHGSDDLAEFNGQSHQRPGLGLWFLLCALGLAGFPITPTFIGEDLVFSHIRPPQAALLVTVASTYVAGGLAVIRLYAKLFLGPTPGVLHGMALRSS